MLVQQNRYIGRYGFPGKTFQRLEAHHHCCHLVFIYENDLIRKLLVVSDPFVPSENLVEQKSDIFEYGIIFFMHYAKILASESLRKTVEHHRRRQVVRHPAIAEHSLYIAWLDNKFCKDGHCPEPAPVIVKRIRYSAPLASFSDFTVCIKFSKLIVADS